MASASRISYRWQLCVPTIGALWVMVIGIAWWQTSRETEYRRNFVDAHLDLVNSRIVEALNEDKAEVNSDFLRFIGNYFDKRPIFSNIRITLYNKNWDVIHAVGAPIALTNEDKIEANEHIIERQTPLPSLNKAHFFYKGLSTNDKEHFVVTALPIEGQLEDYLYSDRTKVWITLVTLALCVTLLILFMARRFYTNLKLLNAFARRSANDSSFTPGPDFPHDEIGDVARQIVMLYNDKNKARKRIDQEHAMAMKAIEESSSQKRQLTNNINHELKSPIGVIKGYLDTLVSSPDLSPEVRDNFIRKARDHANRLVDLIADVSAITRLEDGKNLITTDAIDYHDIAYNFANDINESGMIGSMDFNYDIPPGTYVKGNSNLLTGMLMNLAKNACNYSGGTMCGVELVGLTEDGQQYEFAFYDNGSGVPEESLPHMFERFYRIDSGRARKSGGTGLGLAIVANTIRAHGGKLECSNRPGMGFQITFWLPRAATRYHL